MKRWIAIAVIVLVAMAVPQVLNPSGYWMRVFTLTLL